MCGRTDLVEGVIQRERCWNKYNRRDGPYEERTGEDRSQLIEGD